jgi:hypothetical protein
VQAAPVGLASALAGITAAAGTAKTAGWAFTFWKGIMMTKMQMAGSVAILALTIPLLLEQRTINRLRQQNLELQQRLAEAANLAEQNAGVQGTASQSTPTLDLERQSELSRLRAEAARARLLAQEVERLRSQSHPATQQLPGNTVPSKAGEWHIGEMKSKGDMANAGFLEPQSTVQTLLWSMANGEAETYLRALRQPPNEPMPTAEQLGQAVAAAKKDFATVIGFQLDSTQSLTENQVLVRITLLRSNSTQTPDSFVLERTGTDWKIVGGPVSEGATPPQAPVSTLAPPDRAQSRTSSSAPEIR